MEAPRARDQNPATAETYTMAVAMPDPVCRSGNSPQLFNICMSCMCSDYKSMFTDYLSLTWVCFISPIKSVDSGDHI